MGNRNWPTEIIFIVILHCEWYVEHLRKGVEIEMNDSPELEHAVQISRLLKMKPKDIEAAKLHAIIKAIQNKELSEADVFQYTNITPDQLQSLLLMSETDKCSVEKNI